MYYSGLTMSLRLGDPARTGCQAFRFRKSNNLDVTLELKRRPRPVSRQGFLGTNHMGLCFRVAVKR